MIDVSLERFEELVGDALDSIPPDLGSVMENVAVVVDDETPPGNLLGLYQGVPLTRRGINYSATPPDRITIYMRAICRECSTDEQVVAMVRKVVIHEVGHHFGIDDRRLTELGWG